MKALAIVALLAGTASAGPIIVGPTGWKGGASPELVTRTGADPHFGGVHGVIEAEQYAPDKPGVVLYATRISANSAARDAAARAEIEAMRPTTATSWNEQVDHAAQQLVVAMTARDPSTHIDDAARLVIVGAGESVIVATKGECVAAPDADPAAVKACQAALATLDPGIDAKARVELSLVASATPPAGSAVPTASLAPAHMSDGSRAPMPAIDLRKNSDQPAGDGRPFYVAAGLVFLVGVFWWNRRRRQQLEQEDHPDDR